MSNRPTIYYATDRRCYQGAPCSDLAREWRSHDDLLAKLKEKEPLFACTYFPAEGKYMNFIRYKIMTNKFHERKGDALLEAYDILFG